MDEAAPETSEPRDLRWDHHGSEVPKLRFFSGPIFWPKTWPFKMPDLGPSGTFGLDFNLLIPALHGMDKSSLDPPLRCPFPFRTSGTIRSSSQTFNIMFQHQKYVQNQGCSKWIQGVDVYSRLLVLSDTESTCSPWVFQA